MILAAAMGAVSSYAGLLLSYHLNLPASPAIILAAGCLYVVSVAVGPLGGLLQAIRQARATRLRLSSIQEHEHE